MARKTNNPNPDVSCFCHNLETPAWSRCLISHLILSFTARHYSERKYKINKAAANCLHVLSQIQ